MKYKNTKNTKQRKEILLEHLYETNNNKSNYPIKTFPPNFIILKKKEGCPYGCLNLRIKLW